MPLFSQYEGIFRDDSRLEDVLVCVYTSVLEFHSKALRFFNRPGQNRLCFAFVASFFFFLGEGAFFLSLYVTSLVVFANLFQSSKLLCLNDEKDEVRHY